MLPAILTFAVVAAVGASIAAIVGLGYGIHDLVIMLS